MGIMDTFLDDIESRNREYLDRGADDTARGDVHRTDPDEELELLFSSLPGRKLLDAGCGTARYAGRFRDAGLDYVGIDLSLETLGHARQRCPDLLFAQMSFRRLAFPDGHFDGVWCFAVLNFAPKSSIPAVLGEFRRVLKPGGKLLIGFPDAPDSWEEINYEKDAVGYYGVWPREFLVSALSAAAFSVDTVMASLEFPFAAALATK